MKILSENPEVLIVDDITDAAKSYAELINVTYKLNTVYADNEDCAIKFINNYNIKVVVLDQVMPQITGTELLVKIRRINPNIKALMLTGEATTTDIGKAINIGFNQYLNKNEISKLPDVVMELYLKHEIDFHKKHQQEKRIPLFFERKFLVLPVIKYNLINIVKSNNSFVFPDQWRTISSIKSGEEKEYSEELTQEDKVIVTKESEDKVSAEFGLSSKYLEGLKNSVNREIIRKFSSKVESTKTKTTKISRKYALPQQPANLEDRYIVRRVIEITPVYQEYKILIEKKCSLCDHTQLFLLTAYRQTNKYSSKQIDYFSDETSKTTNIGNHEIN